MEIVSDNYILKISNIVEYENYIIKKYEHRFNFIDQIVENEILFNEKLQKLGISYIPNLIAVEKNLNTTKLYFEKIEGRVLSSIKLPFLTMEDKIMIVCKIVNIVKLLHMNNIVHNDLRMCNIIISEKKDVYLLDFALSTNLNEKNLLNDISALSNIISKMINIDCEIENNDINSYIKKIGEIKYELLYKRGASFKEL